MCNSTSKSYVSKLSTNSLRTIDMRAESYYDIYTGVYTRIWIEGTKLTISENLGKYLFWHHFLLAWNSLKWMTFDCQNLNLIVKLSKFVCHIILIGMKTPIIILSQWCPVTTDKLQKIEIIFIWTKSLKFFKTAVKKISWPKCWGKNCSKLIQIKWHCPIESINWVLVKNLIVGMYLSIKWESGNGDLACTFEECLWYPEDASVTVHYNTCNTMLPDSFIGTERISNVNQFH